ncbi:hypothetical protein [Microvirga arsenatis]|uniref:Uncharacterized protein n=1 Tax=Microvirga arsenatis TaxID=2692265 RepID=A0ABW9YUL1_9HYPH|nr:hypothetical protein [Microvirga arsenatis]NBJ09429.1 hypothetical protein [Microvirga arsenatis]NBJ23713.1 hypothetical protein [Microvirga arsenatis]
MPYAANTIRALAVTPEVSRPRRRGAGSRVARPVETPTQPLMPSGSVAATRRSPRSTATAMRARMPVSLPESCHRSAIADTRQPHGGVDTGQSIEGLLDEEFDDFGCDLSTLLRLANGP